MTDRDELAKAIAELRTLSETFQKDASHLQARGDSCGAKRLLECAGLFCAVCSAAEQAQAERERAAAFERKLMKAVKVIREEFKGINHDDGCTPDVCHLAAFLARYDEQKP